MESRGIIDRIHPLSIEAISPTIVALFLTFNLEKYPSSVNRGYFSYGYDKHLHFAVYRVSILCQSRLFLLPARAPQCQRQHQQYPSSVNRGYFSYDFELGAFFPEFRVSILCQSRLFLLQPQKMN